MMWENHNAETTVRRLWCTLVSPNCHGINTSNLWLTPSTSSMPYPTNFPYPTDQTDANANDQRTICLPELSSPLYNKLLDQLPTENDRKRFLEFCIDHSRLNNAKAAEAKELQVEARQFIAEYLGKISDAESAKISQMISDCHGAADREVAQIVTKEIREEARDTDGRVKVVVKTLQRYREIFALATLRWEDRQRFDEKLANFEQTLKSLKSRTVAKIKEALATRFRGTNLIPKKYDQGRVEFSFKSAAGTMNVGLTFQ